MKFNFKKIALVMLIVTVLACVMSVSAFAAGTAACKQQTEHQDQHCFFHRTPPFS